MKRIGEVKSQSFHNTTKWHQIKQINALRFNEFANLLNEANERHEKLFSFDRRAD